jgi:hypothetical protein
MMRCKRLPLASLEKIQQAFQGDAKLMQLFREYALSDSVGVGKLSVEFDAEGFVIPRTVKLVGKNVGKVGQTGGE